MLSVIAWLGWSWSLLPWTLHCRALPCEWAFSGDHGPSVLCHGDVLGHSDAVGAYFQLRASERRTGQT